MPPTTLRSGSRSMPRRVRVRRRRGSRKSRSDLAGEFVAWGHDAGSQAGQGVDADPGEGVGHERLDADVHRGSHEGTLVFYNEPAERILGRPFAAAGEIAASDWETVFQIESVDGQPLPLEQIPAGIAFLERRAASGPLRVTALDGGSTTRDDRLSALQTRTGLRGRCRALLGITRADHDLGLPRLARNSSAPTPSGSAETRPVWSRLSDGDNDRPRRRHRDPQPRSAAGGKRPPRNPSLPDALPPRPRRGNRVLRPLFDPGTELHIWVHPRPSGASSSGSRSTCLRRCFR